MFRSDFIYTPDPTNSPCFFEVECQHKQKTMGKCRKSCFDYNEYENIKLEAIDKQNEYRVRERYYSNTLEKQEKRAKR